MRNLNLNILPILFCIVTMTGCKKTNIPKNAPTCVQNEIKQLQSEEVQNPPVKVWQYDYNGQTVYYISSYCCDIPSKLFDNDCNQICSPDGGITGAGDGKCKDFFNKRRNKKLIWQDDRK